MTEMDKNDLKKILSEKTNNGNLNEKDAAELERQLDRAIGDLVETASNQIDKILTETMGILSTTGIVTTMGGDMGRAAKLRRCCQAMKPIMQAAETFHNDFMTIWDETRVKPVKKRDWEQIDKINALAEQIHELNEKEKNAEKKE